MMNSTGTGSDQSESSRQWDCSTVLVRHYNDNADYEYALVKNATVILGTGPDGNFIGSADEVELEGVPLDVRDGDDVFIGEILSDTDLTVSFRKTDEGRVAAITKDK